MTVRLFAGYLSSISVEFNDFISGQFFSSILVSIDPIYQTLIPKHLEVCQKYSATHRIFNSLLDVWR